MAITKRKVSFEFNLKDYIGKKKNKVEAKELVGAYLIDAIGNDLSSAKSPVTGKWLKGLTSDYRKFKKKQGKSGIPNLELTSDMLSSLEWRDLGGNRIEVGIFDSNEAKKAYNHNIGDTLPQRQFIPDKGESFRRSILNAIPDLVEDIE